MHKRKLFKRNSVILLMMASIICTSLFLLLPVKAYASNVITFPDSQPEAVIRAQINKPTGDILDIDVSAITSLSANNKGIFSLEGIQYLKSLKTALLDYNQIRDISPLSTLTSLTSLSVKTVYVTR